MSTSAVSAEAELTIHVADAADWAASEWADAADWAAYFAAIYVAGGNQ